MVAANQATSSAIVLIAILLAVVIVMIILIILGYIFNWDWTGLNATDFTSTPQNITRTIAYQPGKTLWDWLQLIFVPVILTLGAVWFTARQNHDRAIAEKQMRNDREIAQNRYKIDRDFAVDNR